MKCLSDLCDIDENECNERKNDIRTDRIEDKGEKNENMNGTMLRQNMMNLKR
jgi:hypothetical protein